MGTMRRSRRILILGACALCLAAGGCYYILDYFADIAGLYGIHYKWNGYPSEHDNVLNFNKSGNVTVQTPDELFGGPSPTKNTWTQDKDKVRMEFSGTSGSVTYTTTFNGVLKDNKAKEIKDGTFEETIVVSNPQGPSTYHETGTWTAIKK